MKNLLVIIIAAITSTIAHGQTTTVFTGIQKRSANLVYISETDSPVNAFISPAQVKGQLTPISFVRAMRLPQAIEIEERDWETVFDNQENGSGEWTELRNFINWHTTDQRIYVTGTIQRQVWFVGLIDGRIIGAVAYTVET